MKIIICLMLIFFTASFAAPVYAGGKHATVHVKRDSDGRIARSYKAKKEFMRQTGYPNGRKGYVVDHVIPLYKGGPDKPSNMAWQTIKEAKEKDKWE